MYVYAREGLARDASAERVSGSFLMRKIADGSPQL